MDAWAAEEEGECYMYGYGERERAEVSAMLRGGEVHGCVMVLHEMVEFTQCNQEYLPRATWDDCVDLKLSMPYFLLIR